MRIICLFLLMSVSLSVHAKISIDGGCPLFLSCCGKVIWENHAPSCDGTICDSLTQECTAIGCCPKGADVNPDVPELGCCEGEIYTDTNGNKACCPSDKEVIGNGCCDEGNTWHKDYGCCSGEIYTNSYGNKACCPRDKKVIGNGCCNKEDTDWDKGYGCCKGEIYMEVAGGEETSGIETCCPTGKNVSEFLWNGEVFTRACCNPNCSAGSVQCCCGIQGDSGCCPTGSSLITESEDFKYENGSCYAAMWEDGQKYWMVY